MKAPEWQGYDIRTQIFDLSQGWRAGDFGKTRTRGDCGWKTTNIKDSGSFLTHLGGPVCWEQYCTDVPLI